MPLTTFDTRFPDRDLVIHAVKCPSSAGETTPPGRGVALGGMVAVAYVNHGRWVADCPLPGCDGAEFVSLRNPVFFCCECRNQVTAHLPIPVQLPSPELRAEVERCLVARPVPATRNWLPGEPVAGIESENALHEVSGGGGSE